MSFQVKAEETWKPFGYELGADLKFTNKIESLTDCYNSLNGITKNVPLNRDEIKCYKATTDNQTFNEIFVITNLNNQVVNIMVNLSDIMPQFECTEYLYDMRKLAVNKYNFNNDTSSHSERTDYFDKEKSIQQKKMDYDTFYRWIEWRGVKDNITIEVQCLGWAEDATIDVKWWLNTIGKTPSIDTNI